jgi:tRNA(Ile2) C34 agmatinyltransferase TiaS
MRTIKNTPDVINPTCPFCAGIMETSILRCIKCGKPAGEYHQ